jgi:D-alanyl-lipoteichoic acid acyltransferase DltB (MBOAT superfamily)
MLFNSQIFLLVFLPLTLLAYYGLAAERARREWLLIFASLLFYGYWDYRLVPLLVFSVIANWLFSWSLRGRGQRTIVSLGIALNLAIIGFFKYADFFADTLAWATGGQHQPWNIILPLGISFFTFQQISYLADRHKGDAPLYGFREYFVYIAFFPQLIAGPIVRHNQFIYQLKEAPTRNGLHERLSRGATMLAIGLFKKVVIADTAARIADPLFEAASLGALTFADAWIATLAFTFQIYFDFSGYSDMAIGLALMFGFTLPINFDTPYRATSIRDFWRRWHITLSRFLRDYLYIELGGNRFGPLRQALAGAVTMFLGGLWHGAGWTFVAWGTMHGLGLAGHAAWRRSGLALPRVAGWALTMLFVMASWVLFRAADFGDAAGILYSLFGGNGVSLALGDYGAHLGILGLAALLAVVDPSHPRILLERDYAKPWIAVAVGLALVALAIEVGSETHPVLGV